MQKHNFAVVFKSSDPEALTKALEYLRQKIPDSLVVFRVGPTQRFLWILEGKTGGVLDESAK
jgi:hypothetical protein